MSRPTSGFGRRSVDEYKVKFFQPFSSRSVMNHFDVGELTDGVRQMQLTAAQQHRFEIPSAGGGDWSAQSYDSSSQISWIPVPFDHSNASAVAGDWSADSSSQISWIPVPSKVIPHSKTLACVAFSHLEDGRPDRCSGVTNGFWFRVDCRFKPTEAWMAELYLRLREVRATDLVLVGRETHNLLSRVAREHWGMSTFLDQIHSRVNNVCASCGTYSCDLKKASMGLEWASKRWPRIQIDHR